ISNGPSTTKRTVMFLCQKQEATTMTPSTTIAVNQALAAVPDSAISVDLATPRATTSLSDPMPQNLLNRSRRSGHETT
ncbi:hypothetical protein, partial [Mucilaginibacter sp. 10I4]